jgi:hypothetical protein
MALRKHIPSHAIIASYRVLISYEGQPITCYGCNATGHVYQVCPKRLEIGTGQGNEHTTTWAHVIAHGTQRADNGEAGTMNDAPTNKEPQAGEHINEEDIETAPDPARPIHSGPSQSIIKEQAILNTGADSDCNTDQPEMPETEIQDTRIDKDEKTLTTHTPD